MTMITDSIKSEERIGLLSNFAANMLGIVEIVKVLFIFAE